MSHFELHPRLATDTLDAGETPLCALRLMNDARFFWALLVPRRANISESFELAVEERARLWQETDALGEFLKRECRADKINIAALGNQVPQLHVHVIARLQRDDAWPGPVWGVGRAQALSGDERERRLALLKRFIECL
ncbi:HIT domain-containing protein [Kushneria aurantia]|uniref:HIT domain-containing protein n=1 Tax=Kushneria aurantia TaxID=504092 RepID=A0ABV6G7D0_9GAMM|nr:HIT domain-containing protein [Kushneria aurantia]